MLRYAVPARLLLVASLALILTGCLTLTPQQQARVVEVRQFADAATAHYDMSRVGVVIEPSTNLGIGARYRLGHLYLNVRMLGSRGLTAIVAHELAHYVLRHDTPVAGSSMGEFQRAQELRELEANAKAVEILMRVKGMTERDAVQTMVGYLRATSSPGGTLGHRSSAEEIADLLERFPASR
jgi:HAMP domain-containing protein